MYESLSRLWRKGKLTEQLLNVAVNLGWIIEEEKEQIENIIIKQ